MIGGSKKSTCTGSRPFLAVVLSYRPNYVWSVASENWVFAVLGVKAARGRG